MKKTIKKNVFVFTRADYSKTTFKFVWLSAMTQMVCRERGSSPSDDRGALRPLDSKIQRSDCSKNGGYGK